MTLIVDLIHETLEQFCNIVSILFNHNKSHQLVIRQYRLLLSRFRLRLSWLSFKVTVENVVQYAVEDDMIKEFGYASNVAWLAQCLLWLA